MLLPLLGIAVVGLGASCAGPAVQESAQAQRLTIEACVELARELPPRRGSPRGWMPDGERYLAVDAPEGDQAPPPRLIAIGARSGEAVPLWDLETMQRAFSALPGVSDDDARAWSLDTSHVLTEARDGLLVEAKNDLFFWPIGAERAIRLTNDPDEEVGATLSPDGRLVGYIHDWNLHVVPSAGGTPLALTAEGDESHLHGRLDWVYQEELYGRGDWQGFWWSPDSRRLAFLILDESEVPTATIVDHRQMQPEVEVWRYPRAGDPNPRAELAVVDAGGGPIVRMDLTRYERQEILIVRVGWTPDGAQVVFQVQDRIQTWLDLCLGDPRTGEVTRLFRDATPVWIEPDDGPHWSADGRRFVWRSERDGWAHLYLYERDGTLVRRLTEGAWEVDAVHAVDRQGRVWFDADRDDVKGSQLYRMDLEGGAPERLTRDGGTHRISLSPTQAFFVDSWSSVAHAGRITVHEGSGKLVRQVDEADMGRAQALGLATPELLQVETRDGFVLEALLLKPAGFDPGRRWPVMCCTYGGPHAPQVLDRWGGFNALYHQMLAQQGYVVWICDNRSASGKGLASVQGVYRDLGRQELADLEDGLDWLVAQGWADPERIGLWGWSYGGYLTAYALTHSQRFKLGIAGAPVTDWRLYDSIYTERYMATPQANPEGYAASSVLEAADSLHGDLLLIHGTIDENVHLENTLLLAERLQKAGLAFRLMLYPGNRHGVRQPEQRIHLYTLMADFIRESL